MTHRPSITCLSYASGSWELPSALIEPVGLADCYYHFFERYDLEIDPGPQPDARDLSEVEVVEVG